MMPSWWSEAESRSGWCPIPSRNLKVTTPEDLALAEVLAAPSP